MLFILNSDWSECCHRVGNIFPVFCCVVLVNKTAIASSVSYFWLRGSTHGVVFCSCSPSTLRFLCVVRSEMLFCIHTCHLKHLSLSPLWYLWSKQGLCNEMSACSTGRVFLSVCTCFISTSRALFWLDHFCPQILLNAALPLVLFVRLFIQAHSVICNAAFLCDDCEVGHCVLDQESKSEWY